MLNRDKLATIRVLKMRDIRMRLLFVVFCFLDFSEMLKGKYIMVSGGRVAGVYVKLYLIHY